MSAMDAIKVLLNISCICALGSVLYIVLMLIRFLRRKKEYVPMGARSGLLKITGLLLVAVWCLRFAVGQYEILQYNEKYTSPTDNAVQVEEPAETSDKPLTRGEEGFNSLVHAFQTFSMDEDYTYYIHAGKAMVADMYNTDPDTAQRAAEAYGMYASVLNVAAPVIGGAVLLDILRSLFPGIILWLSYLNFLRDKYYFSALNEKTLVLVESILEENRKKIFRPVLIIMDSSADSPDNNGSELADKARYMGALCIRGDIVHIHKNVWGKRKLFLIQEAEAENVQTLVELSSTMKARYLKNTEIFYFTADDTHTYVWNTVQKNFVEKRDSALLYRPFGKLLKWVEKKYEQYEKAEKKQGEETDETTAEKQYENPWEPLQKKLREYADICLPTVLAVNNYRNLVANLLTDLPLFEPIVHVYTENRKKNAETVLNLTILGTGLIGTEMFLAAYWCGQILGCRLHITIISKETEEAFRQRINYINPDIFRSMEAGNDILQVYSSDAYAPGGKREPAPVYCTMSYKCTDIKTKDFLKLFDNDQDIGNTHYFFVALGSDDENIGTAGKLRELIGRQHLSDGTDLKTVIAYVVYKTDLCTALNNKQLLSYAGTGNDICMRAVGSLHDMYSMKNISMKATDAMARKMEVAYNSVSAAKDRREQSRQQMKDEYTYWSNMTRAVHFRYKMFSAGVWKKSVFDGDEAYGEYPKTIFREYEARIKGQNEDCRRIQHDLAWLEHRRWNAFLRSRGFRYPACTAAVFLQKFGAQKNLELKLHLCLVECDRQGMRAEYRTDGTFCPSKLLELLTDEAFAALEPDLLDEVTREIFRAENVDFKPDYKIYDYPIEDLVKEDDQKDKKPLFCRKAKKEKEQ